MARPADAGVAAIETLLAAPVVLLLGLSALQWGLVFHGRQAVAHAAQEGARAGSVDHASVSSIERGLARGLAPWLYGASGPEDHAANLERTRAHLLAGQAAGWAAWRRLAPTRESFADWSEPARDTEGRALEGQREIPNDNLTLRSGARLPASGVAGYRDDEPIGVASGQTLNDANLLKIEFVYGVPLGVPVVGRFAAWIMRGVDACNAAGATALRLGSVDLGRPTPLTAARDWACAHYDARDEHGLARPRWPVRVSAMVRMQSPARDAAAAPARMGSLQPGPRPTAGEVAPPQAFEPRPLDRVNPDGAGAAGDGSADRAPGFLRFGADRLVEPPAACGAG